MWTFRVFKPILVCVSCPFKMFTALVSLVNLIGFRLVWWTSLVFIFKKNGSIETTLTARWLPQDWAQITFFCFCYTHNVLGIHIEYISSRVQSSYCTQHGFSVPQRPPFKIFVHYIQLLLYNTNALLWNYPRGEVRIEGVRGRASQRKSSTLGFSCQLLLKNPWNYIQWQLHMHRHVLQHKD